MSVWDLGSNVVVAVMTVLMTVMLSILPVVIKMVYDSIHDNSVRSTSNREVLYKSKHCSG